MLYLAMMLFSLVIGVCPGWALDSQKAKDLEEEMPDLFMLEEGGTKFVLEKGFVIAKMYDSKFTTMGRVDKFIGERVLGTPEEVKEFLREYIKKGMVEFRSHPYPGGGSPKEVLFDGALSLVGHDVLKDSTVEPMLLAILLDPQFDEGYRSSAMGSLAEINFNKNFSTFMKFIDLPVELTPELQSFADLEENAWLIVVPRASVVQLDQLEVIIAKEPNESWKGHITELIANRRAELKKGP